ncbi:hypothetical protein VTN00DRAFT_6994 [Thermoascus crustaceus]|uniref:uncharacterized protein n=1 Tax=Thermoascus crustaceus TaxID=5088 RepID=UPI0037449A43
MFRHQSIYINTNSGISKPEDLRGKRVGTPEYNMTAGVWQRGMLQDDYGLEPESMEWFQRAVEHSPEPRPEKLKFSLPDGLRLSAIPADKNLTQTLVDGELDAIFSATQPSAYDKYSHMQRLFPNFKSVEQDYFKRTGIMPIMRVVVIRRSVYEANPWVSRTLQKAFAASLEYAYEVIEERCTAIHSALAGGPSPRNTKGHGPSILAGRVQREQTCD